MPRSKRGRGKPSRDNIRAHCPKCGFSVRIRQNGDKGYVFMGHTFFVGGDPVKCAGGRKPVLMADAF